MKLKGNILVLTDWSFKDALVQTYTLPYVDIIRKIISTNRKIFLITAEQGQLALSTEEIIQVNKEWSKRNMQLLAEPYKKFGWKKMFGVARKIGKYYRLVKKEKIKTIHAFCTPAGSIAYVLSKLSGAKFIIDSYEPHAEAMVETGAWKKSGAAFKILFAFEKKLAQQALYVIATTEGMKDYAKEKFNFDLQKFFVKPACVDFTSFYPRPKDERLLQELNLEGKLVCVYAGKLGGMYLKDEVFDFVKSCYDHWGDQFRFLFLTPESDELVTSQIQRIGVPANLVIKRFIPHREIPNYLSLGDFGINPQAPVPSKRYGSPIKNGEYWGMGLPVVISAGISDDSDIIEKENIGAVVDFSDQNARMKAIKKIEQLLQEDVTLKIKVKQIAIRYRSFEIAEKIYKEIY